MTCARLAMSQVLFAYHSPIRLAAVLAQHEASPDLTYAEAVGFHVAVLAANVVGVMIYKWLEDFLSPRRLRSVNPVVCAALLCAPDVLANGFGFTSMWSACFVSASLAIQGYISISGHINVMTTMSTGNLQKLAGGMYVVLVAREKLPNTAPLYLRDATLACGFVVFGTILGALLGAASDMNWLYDPVHSFGHWQLLPAAALQFSVMTFYYKLAEQGDEVAVIASPAVRFSKPLTCNGAVPSYSAV